jgi:phosphohistidine phosphatase
VISNLILWRHADAVIADATASIADDLLRPLTPKGERQALRMAKWLRQHAQHCVVISSPAVRALQTAEFLKSEMQIDDAFRPDASLAEVLAALEKRHHTKKTVLIVGHQPWLGALIAHLTQSLHADLPVKKGAIWWLRLSQVSPVEAVYAVLSVQTPSLLK